MPFLKGIPRIYNQILSTMHNARSWEYKVNIHKVIPKTFSFE